MRRRSPPGGRASAAAAAGAVGRHVDAARSPPACAPLPPPSPAPLTPPNLGARFSTKACRPSPPSAPNRFCRKWSRSISSWSESDCSTGLVDEFLAAGHRAPARSRPAARRARRRRRAPRPAAAIWLTRPSALSCFAVTGSAEPDQLQRERPRQPARQLPAAAAVGRQPELGVRHDEARVLGGDHQVAGEHDRPGAAGGRAFDRGDDRLRAGAQRLDELVEAVEHLHLHRTDPRGGARPGRRCCRRR